MGGDNFSPASGAPLRRFPAENQRSILLSPHENELVFKVLGKGRQTLSTAIVQLLYPEGNEWHPSNLRGTVGVLCFVRDSNRRSYFLEHVSLREHRVTFSQELCDEFVYREPDPRKRFITFEGDEFMVGFSFASADELRNFREMLDAKMAANMAKQRRQTERQPQVGLQGVEGKRARGRKTKKKLTKADIGVPTNFVHVQHTGFDPKRGYTYEVRNEKYKALFDKIGISSKELQDKKTAAFINQFIDEYEQKKGQTLPKAKPPPPPVPARPVGKRPEPPPLPVAQSHSVGGGGRANLLSQIHGGIPLRKVVPGQVRSPAFRDPTATAKTAIKVNADGDSHSMEEMGDALRRAMMQREKAIHGDSSSSDEADGSEEEDTSEWDEWK